MAGVVWDLGNVLIDWQPFEAVANGVGRAEAERFFAGFDFGAWNHSCDAGRSWDDAIDELVREHPQWAAHGRAYREHFSASLTGEVPDTGEIVRALHEKGVPQCGLTNWSSELYHAHAHAAYAVLGLLDHVVVSGDEGIAKPDPEIYRIAARRSGLPPRSLVFIDDKAVNVAAAEGIGMHGLVFTGADRLRSDLRDLGLPL